MVTFTDAHLSQLNTLVGEIPHKFAVPIIHFINVVIAEQQKQQVSSVQEDQKED